MNPMKSKTAHSLIVCLILMVGYLTQVQAVTDAELEALEKQIEQQEVEEKKQAETKLEKQRLLEEKRLLEKQVEEMRTLKAEQKRLAEEKIIEEEKKRQEEEARLAELERQREEEERREAEKWAPFKRLEGRWRYSYGKYSTGAEIGYSFPNIELKEKKLIISNTEGKMLHTLDIRPDENPVLYYHQECNYDSEVIGYFKKWCPGHVIYPRKCTTIGTISPNQEIITLDVKKPRLTWSPCTQETWYFNKRKYERVKEDQ